MDKIYLDDLTKYNKVLNQRNKLLKDISFRPNLIDTLSIWDEQLLNYGRNVIKKRKEFIDQLNEIIGERFVPRDILIIDLKVHEDK